MIADTRGMMPDVTLLDCQKRCLQETSCNFMFYGIEAYTCQLGTEPECMRYGIDANRCALFKTCDSRTQYSGSNPIVYSRPGKGKKTIATLKKTFQYNVSNKTFQSFCFKLMLHR